jgi:hypothetical protein
MFQSNCISGRAATYAATHNGTAGGKLMLEILKFVLSGFWPCIGTIILISVVGSAVAEIVTAFRAKPLPSSGEGGE